MSGGFYSSFHNNNQTNTKTNFSQFIFENMGKRNTTGGSAHKGQARKFINSGSGDANYFRMPDTANGEFLAFVSKMLGDGKCRVSITMDGASLDLLCHIRGKFRGRNKKHNLVSTSSVILVCLREWESSPINCDLIDIFDPNSIPSHLLPDSPSSSTNIDFFSSNLHLDSSHLDLDLNPSPLDLDLDLL